MAVDFSKLNSILPSTSSAIGLTPIVKLPRISADLDGEILAKLDYLNPGFSKKDRPAYQIIADARQSGLLKEGQAVVELTSGNMGTGLAIVCKSFGHHFIAVMSKGNSEERALMMRALGAEVILVDQHPDSVKGQVTRTDLELAEQKAEQITRELGAFRVDQWHREGNFRAHFTGTAPEIWSQTEGNFDAFCDFVGSGGTFGGCAAYFKKMNEDIKCFIVEPESAPVLSGQKVSNLCHPIQGGGYARDEIDHLKTIEPDGFVTVSGEQARHGARLLAQEEGIFSGYSSGANLVAAQKLLQTEIPGARVVIIICDSGLKYLSTDLWTDL
jgi:cysteine synthase A